MGTNKHTQVDKDDDNDKTGIEYYDQDDDNEIKEEEEDNSD